jgi:LPS-assembly lipoprotein
MSYVHHLLAACFFGVLMALSGCGFALKGASEPLPFSLVQLQAPGNSLLVTDVIARLATKNVALNTQPSALVPRIALLDEVREKTVASTTTTGRVREYKLVQRVTVQVLSGTGQTWLEPVTLTQSRDFAYNDSQILAKELEELALYKDMQQELVLAILRRLDATRTTPVPKTPAK